MKINVRLFIGTLLGLATVVSPAAAQTTKDPAMRPYRYANKSKPALKTSTAYKALKLSVAPRQKNAGVPANSGATRGGSGAQVAALERETAKTQTARPAQKTAATRPLPTPKANPAETNKPMNFTYQAPKNNATAGTMAKPKRPH
jgi:hypothetical protein